jgi:acetolactate synthase-1/2/3 large subunit
METTAADMTGAEALVGTLADCGVAACFANPGTSEMHLVTALDREPRIRSVLCLFEGVASGAADGHARMTGKPAMTLLHLGPGYLNAGANIHNGRRAHVPMVNVIGDHAVSHRELDAPLASDIAGLAGPNSRWLKSAERPADAGRLAAEAYAASFGPPPGPVSLILPADSAWTKGAARAAPAAGAGLAIVPDAEVEAAADAIAGARRPGLLVNGAALHPGAVEAIGRLRAKGVPVWTDTFVPRLARGAGRPAPMRLPYFAEAALKELEPLDLLVLVGTKPPVAFFAYPGLPGRLAPETCRLLPLGGPESDSGATAARLADALQAPRSQPVARAETPAPSGRLTPATVGASLARHLPEGTLISDDGVTSGLPCYLATQGAAPHEWLGHTGGAIGQGMPVAVGAAVARPDVKTVCLSGDGAGMYTVQALWTMARERLDVVTIVFVNHAYRILRIELERTGAGAPGEAAQRLLGLGGPELDWVKLAEAQGVEAEAAATAEAFDAALARAMAARGPRLVAALMPL